MRVDAAVRWQDIATDRLCLFRFAERAIEFRLRDGLGDSGCEMRLSSYFMAFPSTPGFSGGLNLRSSILPPRNSTEQQVRNHDIMLLSLGVVQTRLDN